MKVSRILPFLFLTGCVAAQELWLTTKSNRLVRVHSALPGSPLASMPITGLGSGERVVGIAFRPVTRQLYATSSASRVYTIDLGSGIASPVAASFAPALTGSAFGVDFNPVVDRIRIVSDADQNLRVDPDTGAVAAVDTNLAYATGDANFGMDPNIVAASYTNAFPGATATTLYGIDSNLDVLVTQNPPNAGKLNTVGRLGFHASAVAGFDIAGATNVAFAALANPGSGVTTSALFRIDLQTGAASMVGILGVGEVVTGLAIATMPGVDYYGVPSPGCNGAPGVGTVGMPRVGNPTFGFYNVNAMPSSVGRTILGTHQLLTPYQALDLKLFVDPLAADTLWLPVTSNATGQAVLPLPIPADDGLAGFKLYAQFAWLDSCTQIGAAASNAVEITIQSSITR